MDIDTKGSSCHHVKTVSLALSFRESRQSHKYNRRHILIQFSGHLVKFNKRIWMSLETKQAKGAHCQVLPLDFYFCLFAWSKCGLDSGPEALVGICSPLRSSLLDPQSKTRASWVRKQILDLPRDLCTQ